MISTDDGDNLHQGKGIISMTREDDLNSWWMIFLRGKDGIPFEPLLTMKYEGKYNKQVAILVFTIKNVYCYD